MKKIYFIYAAIPEKVFNTVKYMLHNADTYRWKSGKMFGLYAWTTSKAIATEFFEIRNKNVYTLIKKDIDEDEYKHIKDQFNVLKLDHRRYYFTHEREKENSIEIVSTKNEFVCTTMDAEEYLFEFGPPINESIPYQIFNDKVMYALDLLGYTKNYDLKYADETQVDFTNNQLSYGLTVLGTTDKIRYDNEMNILLFLFRYFFYGDKQEDEKE